jgi:transcription elongation factor S-II
MEKNKEQKEFDREELLEFSKALKDYKTTGVKQCLSILTTLSEGNITIDQLREYKIGASLSKLVKEETNDPDEKALKKAATDLFKQCKQRDAPKEEEKGNGTQKSASLESSEKKSTKEKESVDGKKSEKKSEKKTEKPERAINEGRIEDEGGVDSLPRLSPDYRNTTLKMLVDGLLLDYQKIPLELEKRKRLANKSAIDIEKVLNEKCDNREDMYRMDARNTIAFLNTKNNMDVREGLLIGKIEVKEFVYKKETFLNRDIKEKMEKNSRRLIDASNADYDKQSVAESKLYQCKKCKSRKIHKIEKQTRGGDEPMTSFFNCVECGNAWKEG